MCYANTFSFVVSSAQYQSDDDEQFEMEPMDTMFEEFSTSRYCILCVHVVVGIIQRASMM